MEKREKEQNESLNAIAKLQSEKKKFLQKIDQLSKEDFQKVIEAIEIKSLIENQFLPNEMDINKIKLILDLYSHRGSVYAAICVFQYGKIQGKRNERKERKKKAEKRAVAKIEE